MKDKKIKVFLTISTLLLIGCMCVQYCSYLHLRKMVGQMIMTGFHGDGTDKNDPNFVAIKKQIKSGQIGGVILFDVDLSGLTAAGMSIAEAKQQIFSSNIKNTEQLKKLNEYLQSIAPDTLLIAIDQEGGNIQRLKPEHGFAPIPSAKQLAHGDTQTTYNTAFDLGQRLGDLGFNVDFAPLLDVDVNPQSPAIGAKERSFSKNPETVIKFADAFARGLGDAHIAYSFKHFPGHGSATGDTHEGITDITKTYQKYELKPWETLLKQTSPYAMVMVAHVVNNDFDTLPASLSQKTINMVRDMGFDGVIVSDDMDMGAITNKYGIETAVEMAINAGNDILVFGNNLVFDKNRGRDINKMIIKMVNNGTIQKSRIKESYERIKKLKENLKQTNPHE